MNGKQEDEFDIAADVLLNVKQTPSKPGPFSKEDVLSMNMQNTQMILDAIGNQNKLMLEILSVLRDLQVSSHSNARMPSQDIHAFPAHHIKSEKLSASKVSSDKKDTRSNYHTPVKTDGDVFDRSFSKQSGKSLTPDTKQFLTMSTEQQYEWCYANGQPTQEQLNEASPGYEQKAIFISQGKPRIVTEGPNGALLFFRRSKRNGENRLYRCSFSPQEVSRIRESFLNDNDN